MTEITRYTALNMCLTLLDAHIRVQSWNQTKLIPVEECEKANAYLFQAEKIIKEMMLENRPQETMTIREEAGRHEVGPGKGKDAGHDAGKVGHADGSQPQASEPLLPASGVPGGHSGHDHAKDAQERVPDIAVRDPSCAAAPAKIGRDGQVSLI